jgi:hypothetical protein
MSGDLINSVRHLEKKVENPTRELNRLWPDVQTLYTKVNMTKPTKPKPTPNIADLLRHNSFASILTHRQHVPGNSVTTRGMLIMHQVAPGLASDGFF